MDHMEVPHWDGSQASVIPLPSTFTVMSWNQNEGNEPPCKCELPIHLSCTHAGAVYQETKHSCVELALLLSANASPSSIHLPPLGLPACSQV